MEGHLVAEFSSKTGSDAKTACMYLQTYNWDLDQCLDAWFRNQNTKNSERSEARKLARGISRATDNENLVLKARDAIAKDYENNRLFKINDYHVEVPNTTFLLPDFSVYCEDLRKFLERDLIEKSVMSSLEASSKLNWWCSDLGIVNRLWPISTTGDGNCLLHAASLSTFGFHDRMLTLRNALHRFITNSTAMEAIKRRWRWQQTKANKQSNVQYSEEEWEQEWNTIVDIASAKKRKSNQQGIYESLEEIHILVLAHVLQRVIIVISETMLKDSYNQPLAPINFGGIYVPFECDVKKCHKCPILLTYDMAHFSALVFMEKGHDAGPSFFFVPITSSNGELLPIQFYYDPGENYNWENFNAEVSDAAEKDLLNLLKPYLDVIDYFGNNASPDNDSEDEIERQHFFEYSDMPDTEGGTLFTNKNKAAKQLQVLGKQMGSIGKSMSRKLKRNFGSLTKLAVKPKKKEGCKERILCAEVRIKRHAYQAEMIHNYLKYVEDKYIKECLLSHFSDISEEDKAQVKREGLVRCVNAHCDSYATFLTSYMCSDCFNSQKKEYLSKVSDSYFGIGKSKFYREPDLSDYSAVKQIPKSNLKNDYTLYLSNSTFFNDTDLPYGCNNNNNVTDLNHNLNMLTIKENCGKVSPVPGLLSTEDAEKQHQEKKRVSSPNTASMEKLISEFDFGQIVLPSSSKVVKGSLEIPTSSLQQGNEQQVKDAACDFDSSSSLKADDDQKAASEGCFRHLAESEPANPSSSGSDLMDQTDNLKACGDSSSGEGKSNL